MALEQDIDDVAFLPGSGGSSGVGGGGGVSGSQRSSLQHVDKRSLYEPTGGQRVRQVVCSQRKAMFLASLALTCILAVALIAAFARPALPHCHNPFYSEVDTVSVPYDDIRLPSCGVVPETYSLHLHPDLHTWTFTGNVSILLRTTSSSGVPFIVLHSKGLLISDTTLTRVGSGDPLSIKNTHYIPKHDQYYIEVGGGSSKQLQENDVCARISHNQLMCPF